MIKNRVRQIAYDNIVREAEKTFDEHTLEENRAAFVQLMLQTNLDKETKALYRNAQYGPSSEQLSLPLFDEDNEPTDFDDQDSIDHKLLDLKYRRWMEAEQKAEFSAAEAQRRRLRYEEEKEKQENAAKSPAKKRKKKKSQKKPQKIRRADEVVVHSLDGQTCPVCGKELVSAGFKSTVKYEYVPGYIKVIEERSQTGVCPDKCVDENDKAIIVSCKPDTPQLIDGSPATPSLVAGIAWNKFILGLPLYRLEASFRQTDIPLSRQTMASQLQYCYETMVRPLYEKILQDFRTLGVVMMDETPLNCLELKKQGSMVVGRSGEWEEKQMTVYAFFETKAQTFVCEILGNDYQGVLMSDGNKAYDNYPGPVKLNCMAHARRRLRDAILCREDYMKGYKKLPVKERKAFLEEHPALKILLAGLRSFSHLYRVESSCHTDPDELADARALISDGELTRLDQIMKEIRDGFEEQTAAWKAANYYLERKDELRAYTVDPCRPIDNNLCEQAVKTFVLGRKNFLFSSSVKGAKAAAGYLTLLVSAIQNGLDPLRYLSYVLDHLKTWKVRKPSEDCYCEPIPAEELEHLVPWSKTLPEFLKSTKEEEQERPEDRPAGRKSASGT